MRDEDDGAAALLPDPQQLEVQALARHLVESAERLVHQEQRRRKRERTGDRNPLLHSAGELPRVVLLEALQLHEVDQLLDPLDPLPAVPAEDLERQPDVLLHGAPVEEHSVLEDDAVVAVEPRPVRALAVDHDVPARRLDQVADDPEERRLAAAGRPDQGDELPGADLEVDALERPDLALCELLRDGLELDDIRLLVHATCSGARRTTIFSTTTTTRKKTIPSAAATRFVAHRFSGVVE